MSAARCFVPMQRNMHLHSHACSTAGEDPRSHVLHGCRGSSCRYSHDLALIVSVNSQERGICFDFLRGQCNRGLLCRFSHDLSGIVAQQSEVRLCIWMETATHELQMLVFLRPESCLDLGLTLPPSGYVCGPSQPGTAICGAWAVILVPCWLTTGPHWVWQPHQTVLTP